MVCTKLIDFFEQKRRRPNIIFYANKSLDKGILLNEQSNSTVTFYSTRLDAFEHAFLKLLTEF